MSDNDTKTNTAAACPPESALLCADCGEEVGQDKGPPDGWQMEDGRTVCHNCCVADFGLFVDKTIELGKKIKGMMH